MLSKAEVSLLGRRFFGESFDVSGFIGLSSWVSAIRSPFGVSAPTVGKSGAALAKKYALGEGTRGNCTGNQKRGTWSRLIPIRQGSRERRGDSWWHFNCEKPASCAPGWDPPLVPVSLLLACSFLGHT